MKFEQLLADHIGEWGKYQKIYVLLVSIPTLFTAVHALSWTFTSAKLPHRCAFPSENASWPYDPKGQPGSGGRDLSVPLTDLSCQRIQGWSSRDYFASGRGFNISKLPREPCPGQYKYDHSELTNSAISEFEIVCDRAWIRALIQSVYYVGQFLGSIFFGILGDKYGRKMVFLGAILLQCVSGSAMAFVPHWIAFAFLRITVGFCHPGIFVIAVVIGMELVGPKHRKVAGVISGAFYAVGQIILGSVAYAVRDYKHLQLIISVPGVLFLAYWWIIPESARWLISQKRYGEAHVILERAARLNGRSLPPDWADNIDEEKENAVEEKGGLVELVRVAPCRRRLILMYICWPVVSGVYYGLSMNPTFFGGHRYFTFIAAGFMEIPGLVLSFFTLDRWGRKFLCFLGYLTCGLCLFSTLIVPDSTLCIAWLKAVQVVISKMAITTVYATIYTWTPELFPTPVRNSALGSCSMMARIGAISASYISMWLVEKSRVAVVVIFASAAFLACFATLFLPETAGIRLPETFKDIKSTKLTFLPVCLQGQREEEGKEEEENLKPINA